MFEPLESGHISNSASSCKDMLARIAIQFSSVSTMLNLWSLDRCQGANNHRDGALEYYILEPAVNFSILTPSRQLEGPTLKMQQQIGFEEHRLHQHPTILTTSGRRAVQGSFEASPYRPDPQQQRKTVPNIPRKKREKKKRISEARGLNRIYLETERGSSCLV